MHMSFGRSDVLICPVDTPIIVEDSRSQRESKRELPLLEELVLKRSFPKQEIGVMPIA